MWILGLKGLSSSCSAFLLFLHKVVAGRGYHSQGKSLSLSPWGQPCSTLTTCHIEYHFIKYMSLGNRAFAYVGLSPWNTLPSAIRSIHSVQGLKKALKTLLFCLAFAH